MLDAAIGVLGRQGMRGLTHRAVDAAAGVPGGTTSNYFRSRDALLDGVVSRVVILERPDRVGELAETLAAFVMTAVTERREVTLARFALMVEAANHPRLQRVLGEAAAEVSAWAVSVAAAAGSSQPERDAGLLGAQVDAMTLHQLAYPDPGFDPLPALRVLVDALMG
ncbi:TetR family transcriptional regulator [Actinoplanes sp. NPDC051633]|uniref:TetR/AcrR family transcriptional regulator n=1 Tax=Actinoplanes sp. NPDC051633 TaxID=3155670 RepID=UPI0034136C6D